MAIRMIGLDLDGTLFNSRKQLTPHTGEVLRKALQKGIVIVPATGRPRIGLPPELTGMDGIRYAVVTNGAAVYDLRSGRCLYQRCWNKPARWSWYRALLWAPGDIWSRWTGSGSAVFPWLNR